MMSFLGAKDMGIDLGTANTLIYLKDAGIVLNEPSVIAIDKRRDVVIAVGKKAKAMIGKAPSNISVIRPLRDGVISDFDRTADMLKAFIDMAKGRRRSCSSDGSIGCLYPIRTDGCRTWRRA